MSQTAILASSASKARGPLLGTEVRVVKALEKGKARISWLRPAWGDAEEVALEETRLWGKQRRAPRGLQSSRNNGACIQR